MLKKIEHYIDVAKEMIDSEAARIELLEKIDQMVDLDYKLPKEMSELKWMRTIVSTDPLAVITTGVRTLSTVEPGVFVQPLNDNPETKTSTNELEQNLLWQLRQASKRAKNDIVGDVVESSLRYDMVVTGTFPIKWQLKGSNKVVSSHRLKSAMKSGGFMVLIENPKNVFARFSSLGLDAILIRKVMTSREACNFYGDQAIKLFKDIQDETQETFVTVFDYWDYDARIVWCTAPSTDPKLAQPTEKKYTIIKEKMPLTFLPWTVNIGGTSLAGTAGTGVRPILGPIAQTNMWETQNIAQSLAFAEAIAYSAAPRGVVYSFADDEIRIDYGDINKPVRLRPGEEYKQLNPPGIDENLLHVYDRTGASMDKLTGIKNLANLDPPSGTAFATVNAVIKAATSALDPAKKLAEEALGGICENMIRWTAFTKDDMIGFGYKNADKGKQFRSKPDMIQEDKIYVDVQLSAHVPTDRIQRINAAGMLNRDLEFSLEDAYAELDIANTEEIRDRWNQEQLDRAILDSKIKELMAQTDLKIEAARMQIEMQAQEQMAQKQMERDQQMQEQAAQQAQQAGGQQTANTMQSRNPGANPQTIMGGQRGVPAQGGAGFNPAQGGQSPNTADPENQVRERVNNSDRGGGELAT